MNEHEVRANHQHSSFDRREAAKSHWDYVLGEAARALTTAMVSQ
jgi:hypothetical protein